MVLFVVMKGASSKSPVCQQVLGENHPFVFFFVFLIIITQNYNKFHHPQPTQFSVIDVQCYQPGEFVSRSCNFPEPTGNLICQEQLTTKVSTC